MYWDESLERSRDSCRTNLARITWPETLRPPGKRPRAYSFCWSLTLATFGSKRVSSKSWERFNFYVCVTFHSMSFIVSILFTRVRTEKLRDSGNPPSLRSADVFPVVASLPPKNSYFWRERSDDRKYVCASQAKIHPVGVQTMETCCPFLKKKNFLKVLTTFISGEEKNCTITCIS